MKLLLLTQKLRVLRRAPYLPGLPPSTPFLPAPLTALCAALFPRNPLLTAPAYLWRSAAQPRHTLTPAPSHY